MRAVLAAILCWVGFGSALAQDPAPRAETVGTLRAEVVEFGEYAATPVLRVEDAPGTASGVVNISASNPPLLRRTAEVSAFDGVRFGMVVQAYGLRADQTVPITVRTTYPGLRTPDGRVLRQGTYPSTLGAGPKFLGYCFDRDWELVPGTWSFSVLYEGRVIASQRFTVRVGAKPDGREHCNAAPSIS